MTTTKQKALLADLIELGKRRGYEVLSPKMMQKIQEKREARQQQRYGRALRGRVVHAQRARKLRRRGEDVRKLPQTTGTGKAIYRWIRKPVILLDYQVEMLNQLRTRSWTIDAPAGAGKGAAK